MNYAKQKNTTNVGIAVRNFDKIKDQFLLDIEGVKMMEDIPDELVVNWDQSGINMFQCLTGLWNEREPSKLRYKV